MATRTAMAMDGGMADMEEQDVEDMEEEEEEIEDAVDDEPMRVLERVFVGSVDAAWNTAALQRKRIGIALAVLDRASPFYEQCAPCQSSDDSTIARHRIALEDAADAGLFERLPSILDTLDEIISEAAERDVNILVHCEAGRSRSPAIVMAWMMAKREYSLQRASDHFSLVRPWIDVNAGFVRDLECFDRVLHGSDSGRRPDNGRRFPAELASYKLLRLRFPPESVAAIVSDQQTTAWLRLDCAVKSDSTPAPGMRDNSLFPHTTVAATTIPQQQDVAVRHGDVFAFLLVDRMDHVGDGDAATAIQLTAAIEMETEIEIETETTLTRESSSELPLPRKHIASATSRLVAIHFRCLGQVSLAEPTKSDDRPRSNGSAIQ